MKTFTCACENRLFFQNSACLGCGREVGWCPVCEEVSALLPEDDHFRCGNSECEALLIKCGNYVSHNVCNRCIEVGDPSVITADGLCDCCRLNDTIPDLSVTGNLKRWYELELAKRRLIYDLKILGLPLNALPPLRFDFKADAIPIGGVWHDCGQGEKVYTGHDDGKITINVREADSVERERLRVGMNESKRTLIGHFRHEIGHYYWQTLIQGQDEMRSTAIFGDHTIDYMDSLKRYYLEGPKPGWRSNYVSAYATMHPWEDFAETFALFLEIVSVLDTCQAGGIGGPGGASRDMEAMIRYFRKVGIFLNEMNRTVGLSDAAPEIINQPLVAKLIYIHGVVSDSGHRVINARRRPKPVAAEPVHCFDETGVPQLR